MLKMNTQLSQKTSSRTFQTNISLSILEIVLLTLIGAVGVLLHARFRLPLHIPGHWGIIYMTLLFSGRLYSQKKYASSLSSLGAAFMLLLPLGYKDPFMPVMYVLPGLLLDVFYAIFRSRNHHFIFVGLLSGIAYMTIPIIRMIISLATGFFYGSFTGGFIYPTVMHFVFGALGGLLALGIFSLFKKNN
jgi:hypothetical protein